MSTLDKINGEALSVPGLKLWCYRPSWNPNRFAIVAQNDKGAVEVWSEPAPSSIRSILGEESIGGVEIHSPKKLYDFATDPASLQCDVLGGKCWGDGSSLAYSKTFLPMIRAGASAEILGELAEWHSSHFGGDS